MPNFQMRPQDKPKVEEPQRWNFSPDGEKRVLGFSGKLHSGKSTCRNFLMQLAMNYSLGVLKESHIDEQGRLIAAINENEEGVIDLTSRNADFVKYMDENVHPFMKPFSCAGPLKSFCVNVLGLNESLVYGNQEEKNQLSDILWQNVPGYTGKKKGRMSGREVMETFGTEVVRKINSKSWSNALRNDIVNFGSLHSIVDDVRFVDEIEDGLRPIGGKVIRLTLTTPESEANTHASNCSLDDYEYFDATIDNQNMTMEETFVELINILTGWGWFRVVN